MLIAHLTDCHVVEPGALVADRVDTAAALRRAVAVIRTMEPRPEVVLATGDLVNDGRPGQYDHLMALLEPLDQPVLPIPGNHDVRSEVRARFPVVPDGPDDAPVDYVVDDHPVRLIGLDTSIVGSHAGRLSDRQLAWLDERLGEAPERPTLLFQHHPPFRSGIAHMDAMGLDGIERLASVLVRYRNVEAVVCGHLHRAIQARFAGTIASCWPSTGAQLALQLTDGPIRYTSEPAAVALHRWDPAGGFTSHLVPVVDREEWTPAWARDRAV
jgi:3',5'-cyclic AMP phosphodiesterase CpdA